MQINKVYNKVVTDLRKSRNGFYSIDQFNADAERAQLDAITQYLEGYSVTQKLHDALSVFKATTYVFTLTTSAGGVVTLPSDYSHLLSGTVIVFDNSTGLPIKQPITFVNEDERDIRLKSQVRPVTKNSPIGVGGANQLQLYPATPQAGEINYLRIPLTPRYAYTLVGRTIVYDAANSQDIEFNDLYMSNVIAKIEAYAAQYLDDQAAQQFSQSQQKLTA
jgi:hypothetical protein